MKNWIIKGQIETLGTSHSSTYDGGRAYDYIKITDINNQTYHLKKVDVPEIIESQLNVGNEGEYFIADYSPLLSGVSYKRLIGIKNNNTELIDGPLIGKLGRGYIGQVLMQFCYFLFAWMILFLVPQYLFAAKKSSIQDWLLLFIVINLIYGLTIRQIIIIINLKRKAKEKGFTLNKHSNEVIL